MGLMKRFKREIRSSNGRVFAFEMQNGFGAALGGLFERVARGKVKDSEIRDIYGFADEESEGPQHVRMAAGPQLTPSAKPGKYTALLSLHGVALYDLEFQPYAFSTLLLSQQIDALANDPNCELIVLDINTPGGHVTGTQEAADAVWAARKKKDVIGIVNPLCASAGYWIASQCTKIIGVPSADVGSIGVFMAHYDCSKMMQDAGVVVTFIHAGEHKVDGNSMQPLSEDARAWFQSEVDDTYRDFIAAVARGRGISPEKVIENFGKGRCYGATMAKRVGMIDEISTIKLALKGVGLTMEMPEDSRRRRGEADEPAQAESAHDPKAPLVVDAQAVRSMSETAPTQQSMTELLIEDTSDCKSATFIQHVTPDSKKVYVAEAWPARMVVGAAVIEEAAASTGNGGLLAVAGKLLTFVPENGAAVYEKVGVTAAGDWVCSLHAGSSFVEPPPSPDQAEVDRKARAASIRRRIAILAA